MTGAIRSGSVALVLGDGEVFKGHWAQVRLPEDKASPSAVGPTSSEMAAVWDTVYGQGSMSRMFWVPKLRASRSHGKQGDDPKYLQSRVLTP
jgi:hypothetical protein